MMSETEAKEYAHNLGVPVVVFLDAYGISIDILGSGYVDDFYGEVFIPLCEFYKNGIEKGKKEGDGLSPDDPLKEEPSHKVIEKEGALHHIVGPTPGKKPEGSVNVSTVIELFGILEHPEDPRKEG